MKNPLVISERVYLRPEEPADGESISGFDHTEPETNIIDGGRILTSPLEFAYQIEVQHKTQPPRFIELSACLRSDDTFIGVVGLWNIDWVNRTAETGSYLGPDYRSQGLGTEAKHLLLEYAFETLHLELIWSTVWELNHRSAAALLKQGYKPAGILKWRGVQGGVYHDSLLFDLTRDDWKATVDDWRIAQDRRSSQSS